MPKQKTISPLQIATRQGEGVATVYLYGYIGQEAEWWLPESERSETITAMALVDTLNDLAKDNNRINLRINSPGGSVFEGEAMVNAILDCAATVHTYNDGIAASMAATIWLAGHERHMARNAKLMIHSPSSYAFGNAQALRDEADKLDKMTEASAESIATLTSLKVEEVMEQFFDDGKDHWMSYKDVAAMNFLKEDETYDAAQTAVNVEQLTYTQLLQQFQATPPQERKPSMFSRVRNILAPSQQAEVTPENPEPVTPQELRAAVERGEITVEQLGAIHQELSTPAPDPQQTLTETLQLAVTTAVQSAMQERDQQITALEDKIKQLGDLPGAPPAGLGAGGDPGAIVVTAVQQDAKFFADAAKNGTRLFRHPSNDLLIAEE